MSVQLSCMGQEIMSWLQSVKDELSFRLGGRKQGRFSVKSTAIPEQRQASDGLSLINCNPMQCTSSSPDWLREERMNISWYMVISEAFVIHYI